jgi:hypothetical protein
MDKVRLKLCYDSRGCNGGVWYFILHPLLESSVSDVGSSVIIRKLVDCIFNIILVFIRQWQIQICL